MIDTRQRRTLVGLASLTIKYMVLKPRSLNMEKSKIGPPRLLIGILSRMHTKVAMITTTENIPMTRSAHGYPTRLMMNRFNGANDAPPIPDPATVIPVAKPRFFSNHWAGTAMEVKIDMPAPRPNRKPYVVASTVAVISIPQGDKLATPFIIQDVYLCQVQLPKRHSKTRQDHAGSTDQCP